VSLQILALRYRFWQLQPVEQNAADWSKMHTVCFGFG